MSLREKYKTFTFKGLLVLDKNFNECPGNKIRKKFTFMGGISRIGIGPLENFFQKKSGLKENSWLYECISDGP